MYRVSDFGKNSYKLHEAAEIFGVTTKTVRNYDSKGGQAGQTAVRFGRNEGY